MLALALGLLHVWAYSRVVEREVIGPARVAMAEGEGRGIGGDLPVVYNDFDGYYYTAFAREMVERGTFRVRWTRLDNAPEGRAVHWSSLFSWWLLCLARVHGWFTGISVAAAVPRVAYYANPLLLGLVLVLAGWAVWRRAGGGAAALFVLALGAFPETLQAFSYGRPDHHGLHLAFALGLLLCLVLGGGGWVRKEERGAGEGEEGFLLPRAEARRWFRTSGVLGGLGLWTGATQGSMVLFAAGLGGLAGIFLFVPGSGAADRRGGGTAGAPTRYDPSLWRTWARTGALVSLSAYAVEYFPGHLGLRLEVNHPLHALAWFCGGELLYLAAARRIGARPSNLRTLLPGACALAGLCLLPAAVFLGPSSWFLVKDPAMLRLHERIGEFAPFAAHPAAGDPAALFRLFGVFLLAIPLACLAACSPSLDRARRGIALLPLPAAALIFAAFLLQERWIGYFHCAALAVLAALFLLVRGERPFRRRALRFPAAALMLLLLLQVGASWAWTGRRVFAGAPPSKGLVLAYDAAVYDAARRITRDAAGRPAVVMCGPYAGSRLHFFSPCRTIPSLYWENLEGVRAAAAFFTDRGAAAERARRIARERGIDYVLADRDRDFVTLEGYVAHGEGSLRRLRDTLAFRLALGKDARPVWLEPVDLGSGAAARRFRLFRVHPERD